MNIYRVEGLTYPTSQQAEIVAQRFAKRYGRDIAVCDGNDKVLYYITASGKRVNR